jgi:Tetratricopeptide repeat
MDMLRELISIQQSQGLKADKTTIAAKINLGTLLIGMDRVHDAVELHVESFELAKEKYGTDHPMTLNVGMRTTQTLQRAGKLDEADEMLAPILDRFANTNGLDHATTISARRLMARILKSRNDKPKAREQLRLAESALTSSRRDPELLKKIQTELKALGPERSQAPEP